jgi:hypothetical protein
MHDVLPPMDALKDWFDQHPSGGGRFGHLLIVQKQRNDGGLGAILRPYFESAHRDARMVFHDDIGIELHPDAEHNGDPVIVYPGSLPSTTRRGLFGEVMAGLVSEGCDLVGGYAWTVPIFLFRHHDDARNYLFDLARNPARTRQAIGRLGTDFVGILLDEDGAVVRYIAAEAKWRQTLTRSAVDTVMLGEWTTHDNGTRVRSGKGVWNDVNNDSDPPTGLRQLQRLLQEYDPHGYDAAILSLERALVLRNPERLPRTDLIIIVGNGSPRRDEMNCLLPFQEAPAEYTAGNDLQLVEMVMIEGAQLIDDLYESLWSAREVEHA